MFRTISTKHIKIIQIVRKIAAINCWIVKNRKETGLVLQCEDSHLPHQRIN